MPRPRRSNNSTWIPKNDRIWADTVLGRFVYGETPADTRKELPDFPLEPGNDVWLRIPQGADNYAFLNLTKCTAQELEYIETVLARAIAAARPICEGRDKNAADHDERGDDSFARVYRQVPQLIVREGFE